MFSSTFYLTSSVAAGSADTVCPRPPLNLTFDRLTFKLVCESHLRWGTFLLKCGLARPLRSGIICYVRDGRTDRRTKATLIASSPLAGGYNKHDPFNDPNSCRNFCRLAPTAYDQPLDMIRPGIAIRYHGPYQPIYRPSRTVVYRWVYVAQLTSWIHDTRTRGAKK